MSEWPADLRKRDLSQRLEVGTATGGVVAQRVELWTCDQQVVGLNPTRGKAASQPWASCSHLCASVTKQYNVVPAKG